MTVSAADIGVTDEFDGYTAAVIARVDISSCLVRSHLKHRGAVRDITEKTRDTVYFHTVRNEAQRSRYGFENSCRTSLSAIGVQRHAADLIETIFRNKNSSAILGYTDRIIQAANYGDPVRRDRVVLVDHANARSAIACICNIKVYVLI